MGCWQGRPALCSKRDGAGISQALIWDLSSAGQHHADSSLDPTPAYNAAAEVMQLQWGIMQPGWVAICF
jgi:hypothetical protein